MAEPDGCLIGALTRPCATIVSGSSSCQPGSSSRSYPGSNPEYTPRNAAGDFSPRDPSQLSQLEFEMSLATAASFERGSQGGGEPQMPLPAEPQASFEQESLDSSVVFQNCLGGNVAQVRVPDMLLRVEC